MSQFDDLLSQVPIDQLADHFGVDQNEMNEAVQTAIPALVGGLEANAADPAGAQSLMNALGDHTSGFDLGSVDQGDGMKIVGNIFGDNTDQVMNRLGGLGGSGGALGPLVKKLLPVLAPLVLSWLAGKMRGGGSSGSTSASGGGGIGDILGNIFGGGGDEAAPQGGTATSDGPLFPGGQGAQSAPQQVPAGVPQTDANAQAPQQQASNPLQDILGQVLGGSGGGGGLGGGLGDILGGLLGGGRR